MTDLDQDPPDFWPISGRDDALGYLRDNDVPLPEGLTFGKVRDRGGMWIIEKDAFSFRLERHPSPMYSMSPAGPPARWHVRKRYRYDLPTGEWEVDEQHREFVFDPGRLIEAVFDRFEGEERWGDAIDRVQAAADQAAAFDEEFAAMEEFYRDTFDDVPDDQVEEMLSVLEGAFRRRAGLD